MAGRMHGKAVLTSAPGCQDFRVLTIPWVMPENISDAVLFLASGEARYVTGVALPVAAGRCLK